MSANWGDWRWVIKDEPSTDARPTFWQSNDPGGRVEIDLGSDVPVAYVVIKLLPVYAVRTAAVDDGPPPRSDPLAATDVVTLELIDETFTTVFSYRLHAGTEYELNVARLQEKQAAAA